MDELTTHKSEIRFTKDFLKISRYKLLASKRRAEETALSKDLYFLKENGSESC